MASALAPGERGPAPLLAGHLGHLLARVLEEAEASLLGASWQPALAWKSALATASRAAPAWPLGPPPATSTNTSNTPAVPVSLKGWQTSKRWYSTGAGVHVRLAVHLEDPRAADQDRVRGGTLARAVALGARQPLLPAVPEGGGHARVEVPLDGLSPPTSWMMRAASEGPPASGASASAAGPGARPHPAHRAGPPAAARRSSPAGRAGRGARTAATSRSGADLPCGPVAGLLGEVQRLVQGEFQAGLLVRESYTASDCRPRGRRAARDARRGARRTPQR
ncbi:unnamed protein product, partial [Prorocentrum cordatum]